MQRFSMIRRQFGRNRRQERGLVGAVSELGLTLKFGKRIAKSAPHGCPAMAGLDFTAEGRLWAAVTASPVEGWCGLLATSRGGPAGWPRKPDTGL